MTGDMPKGRAGAKGFLRLAGDLLWPPRWDRARAALIHDETARRPVLDLERAGRREGLGTLCGWMRQAGRGTLTCLGWHALPGKPA